MEIYFDSKKLEKEFNDQKLLVRQHGPQMAKRIRLRLDDIDAAESLEDFRYLPGRCHVLLGNRSGQFSLDLVHPLRLIFIPADTTASKQEYLQDWTLIKAVLILGIEDTHD